MTSRDLTASMLTAIAAKTVRPAIFYEGKFAPTGISSAGKALLHYDGADGATTTTDHYENTIALATGSTLSTTHAKFGAASLKMNAATNPGTTRHGAEISGITSLGAGGWTADCWFYNDSLVGDLTFRPVSAADSTDYSAVGKGFHWIVSVHSLQSDLYASSNGSSWDIANGVTANFSPLTVGWHHFEATYDAAGGHYYTYIDGVKLHDIASASAICDIQRIWIVPSDYNGSLARSGWIDEWCLHNGCLHPDGTTFTPPTAAYTSADISGPDSNDLHLFTGIGTIDWNGYTWIGGGDLLGFSAIKEVADVQAVGFSVTLSGMPAAKIDLALTKIRQGLPGKLWLGLFDAAGALIADPYMLRRGKFDIAVIDRTGETCTIQAQYEDRLIDLERPRARRYTSEDQKRDYPEDKGFDFVPSLQDMQITWR